jgi:hypothetical protein
LRGTFPTLARGAFRLARKARNLGPQGSRALRSSPKALRSRVDNLARKCSCLAWIARHFCGPTVFALRFGVFGLRWARRSLRARLRSLRATIFALRTSRRALPSRLFVLRLEVFGAAAGLLRAGVGTKRVSVGTEPVARLVCRVDRQVAPQPPPGAALSIALCCLDIFRGEWMTMQRWLIAAAVTCAAATGCSEAPEGNTAQTACRNAPARRTRSSPPA